MKKNRAIKRTDFISGIFKRQSIRKAADEWKLEYGIAFRRMARYAAQDQVWFEENVPAAVKAEMALGMNILNQDRFLPAHSITATLAATANGQKPPTEAQRGSTSFLTAALRLHHGGRVF